jgi:SAM-dependent methyltransferase
MDATALPDLPRYIDRQRLFGRHGFRALDWTGRSLVGSTPPGGDALEVGAGDGLISLWLLHAGARSVISLEPEGDGATHGSLAAAARHRQVLAIPETRWQVRNETLQAFDPGGRRFALILSKSSVNHLDEDACERILEDRRARDRYLDLFARLRDLLVPGGRLVLADCGRVNYWHVLLQRPSPWAPEVEWHKHQEPETWCDLARAVGLVPEVARFWHPFYATRFLGPLLSLRPAARALASYFVVRLRRA